MGAMFSISESIETSMGGTGTWLLQQPQSSSPVRTGFAVSGGLASDNILFLASAFALGGLTQDIVSRAEYRGPTLTAATLPLPNTIDPFTVTESVGAPGENLFELILGALSGNETTAMTTFTGDVGTIGAGNAYTILATKAWMTANGTTLGMQSKAAAGFPASAYLALPRASSSVTRTASNLTGTTKPAGSFITTATRVQIP
jgi:hypothetical protein